MRRQVSRQRSAVCSIVLRDTANASTAYINANFIRGLDDAPDTYIAAQVQPWSTFAQLIAAQGPMYDTVNEFWLMAWQCNVRVIAMATNLEEAGKEKCQRYWPETRGEPRTFKTLTVTLLSEEQPAPQFIKSKSVTTRLSVRLNSDSGCL